MSVHINKFLPTKDNVTNQNKYQELAKACQTHEIALQVKKDQDILKIIKALSHKKVVFTVKGTVVKRRSDNYAFIRYRELNYANSMFDVHVPASCLRKNPTLNNGQYVHVEVKVSDRNKNEIQLFCVKLLTPRQPRNNFHELTPQYPVRQIQLVDSLSSRFVDVISPLGFGQRGLVVAPPKAGKTMLLQSLALEILNHNTDSKLIYLMIGERPEECTETRRVLGDSKYKDQIEILSSTFDESPSKHAEISNLALSIGQEQVVQGVDVIILLDSLTRLTRSHNELCGSSGRVMTGGIESQALSNAKKFLGSARDTEESKSGSLTIIATVLVETGMRMDEVIFEEFKGTGNMEIFLSRKLSERGIYPAIDIAKSGTRRSDLFLTEERYERSMLIKKLLNNRDLESQAATELLIKKLKQYDNNADFFNSLSQSGGDD